MIYDSSVGWRHGVLPFHFGHHRRCDEIQEEELAVCGLRVCNLVTAIHRDSENVLAAAVLESHPVLEAWGIQDLSDRNESSACQITIPSE